MIESNLRLVVHVAKRYQRDDSLLTLPDLVQEGTIGLGARGREVRPAQGLPLRPTRRSGFASTAARSPTRAG